ncbi:uncharacterized protein C9orf85 homolog [Patiria miniata]|uniref:Uncharacterized protein n=1 Tax=Patiria miniata TaxID=46514 RepID=A0A914BTF3_PATMI|nr:uncharacterized protein C9orf85 homolog [Patiria miniata]
MSSQKSKPPKKSQKYQNTTAFKNDLHDTSRKTKALNQMVVGGVCSRCKEQIEWKIKYKKYKPLTQPKKCVKCEQKTVTQAYHIMCKPCAASADVCAKCGKNEMVTGQGLSPAEEASQASQLQAELRHLTERQRRSFFRYQAKGGQDGDDHGSTKEERPTSKGQELDEEDCESGKDDNSEDCELDDRTCGT